MTWEVLATIFGSTLTAAGGFEFIRYIIERKYKERINEAQADKDELHVIRETVEFLQEQLHNSEQKYSEQTAVLRKTNNELIEIQKEKSNLELELQRFRCVVAKCHRREPQNGY